ncbi:acyltransferase 3 [Emticicia oligotrophica DSM 17448]|uniref:Acyltransferase 3 n=1 Tax=Emticicia oligotrophica (strain DSM 17448 / CIP 109782 / MTCC 6937 / GPTSA100-15) TaxID=929562 RepID=A0ABN4AR64_EMTOG|nr:acyltransferase family protein [Emticicia oligotrophica]AFK04933.1 acyltransferase 3 [Emticicia oligotrophica DSM 17448]
MPKVIWISNLRVFATLTVIMLHCAAGGIYLMGKIPDSWWWICNAANAFGRFAVPIFVMLSGYLLLGKYKNLIDFLSKRFSRIFIPFLVWTLIYMLWGSYFGVIPAEKTKLEIIDILRKIMFGGAGGSGHLWFVYMLLGIYLFLPILSKWITQASSQEIKYFLILWVISCTVYPYFNRFLGIKINFEIRYFSGYIGYFVLGYFLGNIQFSNAIPKIGYWALGIFVISWIITFVGIYFSTISNRSIYEANLFDYLSPSVIMMSVTAFLAFKNLFNLEFLPNLTTQIDKFSYGMYLMHLIPMKTISRQWHINFKWIHPIIGISTQFILTALVCYFVMLIISKIPKTSWITG